MEERWTIEDVVAGILADYFATCNVEPFPVNIRIVEDMWQGYLEIRPDHAEKSSKDMEEFQKNNNGTAVPPKDYEDAFTILLHKEYVAKSVENNSADWIGTLVHEAVHVNDFIQFSKLVDVTDYDIVLDRRTYRMFHLWTEFNAKAKGYYFLRKYTFGDKQDERQVQYIIETELPYHINNMFEAYHATNNGDRQMYYIVHFIGRMYIWQKLFPEYFTHKAIKNMFNANKWMYELYIFLTTHTKLEDACRDFDEMKTILKQNFSGLD